MGAEPRYLSLFQDNPNLTASARQRLEVALVVPPGTKPTGEVGVRGFEGGLYATARVRVPIEEYAAQWDALVGDWLPDSGYQPDHRPAMEFYLNNPEVDPKASITWRSAFQCARSRRDNPYLCNLRALVLKRLTSQIRLVDTDLFAMKPPTFRPEVETMLPAVENDQIRFYGGPLQTYLNLAGLDTARETHLPFGATSVLPINRWRLELSGGIGGAYATFHTPYAMTNSWMVQTSVGARAALDPGRHVWLGATTSYITDFADNKRQWVTGTADLTLRFGK